MRQAKPLVLSKQPLPTTIEVMHMIGIGKLFFYPEKTGTGCCAACTPYRRPRAPANAPPWYWITQRKGWTPA